jgi:S-DNA-T family DNA segregation ATPase FtsK/SpoIIIE
MPEGQGTGPGAAEGPESALWAALCAAPPGGFAVWVLMAACGMSRSWVYHRLQEHAAAGRALQVARGSWRAATPAGGHEQ